MAECLLVELSHPVAEGVEDIARIEVDDDGRILECSIACENLFGYLQADLIGRHISLLLPKLEGMDLIVADEINPRLKYLCRCAITFELKKQNGTSFPGEVVFNRLHKDIRILQVIVHGLA